MKIHPGVFWRCGTLKASVNLRLEPEELGSPSRIARFLKSTGSYLLRRSKFEARPDVAATRAADWSIYVHPSWKESILTMSARGRSDTRGQPCGSTGSYLLLYIYIVM